MEKTIKQALLEILEERLDALLAGTINELPMLRQRRLFYIARSVADAKEMTYDSFTKKVKGWCSAKSRMQKASQAVGYTIDYWGELRTELKIEAKERAMLFTNYSSVQIATEENIRTALSKCNVLIICEKEAVAEEFASMFKLRYRNTNYCIFSTGGNAAVRVRMLIKAIQNRQREAQRAVLFLGVLHDFDLGGYQILADLNDYGAVSLGLSQSQLNAIPAADFEEVQLTRAQMTQLGGLAQTYPDLNNLILNKETRMVRRMELDNFQVLLGLKPMFDYAISIIEQHPSFDIARQVPKVRYFLTNEIEEAFDCYLQLDELRNKIDQYLLEDLDNVVYPFADPDFEATLEELRSRYTNVECKFDEQREHAEELKCSIISEHLATIDTEQVIKRAKTVAEKLNSIQF